MFVKVVYSIVIGIVIAALFGFGVEAFYPAPDPVPNYPSDFTIEGPPHFTNENQIAMHSKVVFFTGIGLSLILIIISLFALKKWQVIMEGLVLGGLFTVLFTIFRAATFWPQSGRTEMFFGLLVALIVLFGLAMHQFPVNPRRLIRK